MAKILSEDAERRLANVPEEHKFWCHDGCVMKNLQELRDALANMNDEVFAYHANADRNDFSNWVREIIKDETLARQLARSRDRASAARTVADRICFLGAKLT